MQHASGKESCASAGAHTATRRGSGGTRALAVLTAQQGRGTNIRRRPYPRLALFFRELLLDALALLELAASSISIQI
jgi:hypothetical protein